MKLALYTCLAIAAGLPLGYCIGLALDQVDALFDAYMDGMGNVAVHWPAQVWQ